MYCNLLLGFLFFMVMDLDFYYNYREQQHLDLDWYFFLFKYCLVNGGLASLSTDLFSGFGEVGQIEVGNHLRFLRNKKQRTPNSGLLSRLLVREDFRRTLKLVLFRRGELVLIVSSFRTRLANQIPNLVRTDETKPRDVSGKSKKKTVNKIEIIFNKF